MPKCEGTNGRIYETKKAMLARESKEILNGYSSAITLRQLYYRLVSKNLIENKQSQYQYLSRTIRDARLQGSVNWRSIEDRTREFKGGDTSRVNPDRRIKRSLRLLKRAYRRHALPKWMGQSNYVEVWFEKEALSSLFGDVCNPRNITYFPARGYSSITQLKEAADRLKRVDQDRDKTILYFGDFDPSGQDIERNITERLENTFGVSLQVERVALTKEQIDKHELPPQPAKKTDARYQDFVKEHGNKAVELDALEPDLLKSYVRDKIGEYFDQDYYQEEVKTKEEEEKEYIKETVDKIMDNVPQDAVPD